MPRRDRAQLRLAQLADGEQPVQRAFEVAYLHFDFGESRFVDGFIRGRSNFLARLDKDFAFFVGDVDGSAQANQRRADLPIQLRALQLDFVYGVILPQEVVVAFQAQRAQEDHRALGRVLRAQVLEAQHELRRDEAPGFGAGRHAAGSALLGATQRCRQALDRIVHPAANPWDDRILHTLWVAAERYTHLVFDPTRITEAERARRYETHRVLREAGWLSVRETRDGRGHWRGARGRPR